MLQSFRQLKCLLALYNIDNSSCLTSLAYSGEKKVNLEIPRIRQDMLMILLGYGIIRHAT